jgi:hypothetical protein
MVEKEKIGSPAVRQFLGEVKNKMKNILKDIKESDLREKAQSIVDKITKIEEGNLKGSFEAIRDTINTEVRTQGVFAGYTKYYPEETPWIKWMFADKCIVGLGGKLYQVDYSVKDKVVKFGKPKEVEETYAIKEAELKESVQFAQDVEIVTLHEAQDADLDIADFISLKEAKFNDDFSEVEVVLIEAGTNEGKKRHYPEKTIKEAAPLFKGMKMYINHPTPTEEKERPERNLKDWAATIVESWSVGGKAMGKVAIHDSWLRERLADPVARQHIGLSINTGGKISVGKIGGKEYQIVEKIIPARKNGPPSVDWVTEPGARGRVSRLLETRYRGGKKMELELATIKDLREARSDLVEAIKRETEQGSSEKVSKLEKDLQEANRKIAEFETGAKIAKQVEAVETQLKEAKIPEVSKERIRGQFKASVVEGDLKEAVTNAIAAELEYINKLGAKGRINIGTPAQTDIKESLQEGLDKRAGVAEKKKEGEE